MKTLRMVAWIAVALAIALIGADFISSLEAGQPVIRTAREILNLLPGVAIDPMRSEGVMGFFQLFLDLPLWMIIGVIGLIATILIRPVD
ncbi:hypothetical protein HK107_07360 [Parvularcula sp. ZS-1/3]|uniref:Uncharacterized protein n=1 Tax=Parvularcula mediterranea TaxID=2732508 RepID=A0A7Y3RL92_9PROT|nr:hypothetical protein [Parvularcula mediterranea]NNU16138.1 hypothetical protein [Parvularcula mediterranea]